MNTPIKKAEPTHFERVFNKALKLRDAARFSDAEEVLTHLADQEPESAAVFGTLGQVQWEQGKLEEAVGSFRRSAELAPRSELASLGLFHTLWDSGRRDAALQEMNRFLCEADSREYSRLARDLFYGELSDRVSDSKKQQWARDLGRFVWDLFVRRPGLLKTRSDDLILLLWIKERPDDHRTAELLPAARRIVADMRKARKKALKAQSRPAG